MVGRLRASGAFTQVKNALSLEEWNALQYLLRNSNINATVAERVLFYKELAKLDNIGIKSFYNELKAEGLVFQTGIVRDPYLINIFKNLSPEINVILKKDIVFLKVIKSIESDASFYVHIEGEITSTLLGNTNPLRGGRGGHTHQAISSGKTRFSQLDPLSRNPLDIATNLSYRDINGVLSARIDVYDPVAGIWKFKETAASSFFPSSWSKKRIIDEIASAVHNARINGTFGGVNGKVDLWEGISNSGIKIQGYKSSSSVSGLNTSWTIKI